MPASTAKMLAIFGHQSVRKCDIKRVRKTSFFIERWRAAASALPLPRRSVWKWKRKQMAKKSPIKREHALIHIEKQANRLWCCVCLSVAVAVAVAVAMQQFFFVTWQFRWGPHPTHTHTHTPFAVQCVPFQLYVFFCSFAQPLGFMLCLCC